MKNLALRLQSPFNLKTILVVLCFLFITIVVVAGESFSCKAVECGCQCTNKSGTFEISMKEIVKRGSPPVERAGNTKAWNYKIDPCYGFDEGEECKGVTMCQISTNKIERIPIAKPLIDSCGAYEEGKQLTVTYVPVGTRQMVLNLMYGSTTSISKVADSTHEYTVTITSPTLKPKKPDQPSPEESSGGGPSTGSVLVIIFFVLLVIYLVSGMLFMKYRRGATGKELVPNIEFWSSLPGLIKDGCVFFGKNMKGLCGRCCNRDGYNEI